MFWDIVTAKEKRQSSFDKEQAVMHMFATARKLLTLQSVRRFFILVEKMRLRIYVTNNVEPGINYEVK